MMITNTEAIFVNVFQFYVDIMEFRVYVKTHLSRFAYCPISKRIGISRIYKKLEILHIRVSKIYTYKAYDLRRVRVNAMLI